MLSEFSFTSNIQAFAAISDFHYTTFLLHLIRFLFQAEPLIDRHASHLRLSGRIANSHCRRHFAAKTFRLKNFLQAFLPRVATFLRPDRERHLSPPRASSSGFEPFSTLSLYFRRRWLIILSPKLSMLIRLLSFFISPFQKAIIAASDARYSISSMAAVFITVRHFAAEDARLLSFFSAFSSAGCRSSLLR
jgi:hypothetical protein